jgi:hypothetical protein
MLAPNMSIKVINEEGQGKDRKKAQTKEPCRSDFFLFFAWQRWG